MLIAASKCVSWTVDHDKLLSNYYDLKIAIGCCLNTMTPRSKYLQRTLNVVH